MRTHLIVLSLCFNAALLAAGGASAAQGLAPQSTSEAGVTVKATPRSLANGSWEFDVAFDTHSRELKDDLMKSASLIASGKTHAPAGWKGDPPGGHHRKGVLKFNAIDPRPQAIELRIARPGEPKPRSFHWQLK
ncbi:MAG: hypothetical protein OEP48_02700 [Betaproteobacteria bacterium]|nr:hypothetical protein [Betaproteobacteria bacterium]MDH3435886.1 hypothetical protein [Betaproteobacteria bacterium]